MACRQRYDGAAAATHLHSYIDIDIVYEFGPT